MKKVLLIFSAIIILTVMIVPQESSALGLEIAGGYWQQNPSGHVAYNGDLSGTELDLEDDLDYGKENRLFGRIKAELPLFLPNIYVVATPMDFDEKSSISQNFNFGDINFDASFPFESELRLDHYDITLYYSLPFLRTATLGKLNAEIGLNARIIDFKVEVSGRNAATGLSASESESFTLAVPMVYAGVQVNPVKYLSIEAEGRGIAYNSDHYYDFIGRVKVKPVGPLFFAGGYRFEQIKIDENDVEADLEFAGPFAEVGVQF